jgi:hypothetical protein
MRVRFWRKEVSEGFDPESGEVPEHFEVDPPGRPIQWKRMLLSVFMAAAVTLSLGAFRDYRDSTAPPGPLYVFEGASLEMVCAGSGDYGRLSEVAPCGPDEQVALHVTDPSQYFIAFAARVRKGGHKSGDAPYLMAASCLAPPRAPGQPVDDCVLARLQD